MLLGRKILATAFGGLVLFAAIEPARAAFITIDLPNAIYTGGTTLIPIPAVATLNTLAVTSITGGGQTIAFSSPDPGTTILYAQPPVPVGFQTWNSPPFVETNTPRIIQDQVSTLCATCTLTLSFSTPVKTFGVELESDPLFNIHTLTETFFNGAATVGSITKTMNGNASARLFAATTDDQQFTSVKIMIDGTDFALAQFRFSAQAIPAAGIPEPGTILLMACGLLAVGYGKRRQAR